MHIVCTVTTYPSDPQASIGLHRCMDILHRMQNIWPSAWRAYQILQGSKVRPHELRASVSPSGSERRKRNAERALEHQATPIQEALYRDSQGYARVPHSSQSQQAYPIALDIPQAESSAFFPSFERWGPDSNAMNSFSSGSLSTSVLPQQFSTGYVDERSQRNSDRTTQRFPQYWNDYSAIGQIDSAYPVPPNGMVPSNSVPPSARSSQQGVVYSQDQFLVFSEHYDSLHLCCLLTIYAPDNIPPSGQS